MGYYKISFPESHCGSRVLTTTRIESVAMTCCNYQSGFIYRMKPLDDHNSRQLFYRRVFGSGNTCPQIFEEPSGKILKQCGGLPLAIISIASLLASQSTRSLGQWNYVLDSLRHNMGSNPTLEGMRQILNLSYTHLPHHLKTCLIYIGMYPEDHQIEKDHLVMQWVAEGFVSGFDRRDAVEIAGSYFNELVNRSMIIQLVDDKLDNERFCYEVHDMVLSLILSKCTEENFLCVVENIQAITTGLQYKARRLSLQFDKASQNESVAQMSVPHIRSLFIFRLSLRSLGLIELKFLRVMFIQNFFGLDLTPIGKLFQLRYLCIQSYYTSEVQLPRQISRLQFLETLMISSCTLFSLPPDIVRLPALSNLKVEPAMAYPDGIGNLKSLHTLCSFDPNQQTVDTIRALGELANLRELNIGTSGSRFVTKEAHMDALLSSLEKLMNCNLRRLTIGTYNCNVFYYDRWGSLCFSCCHLEQLHLDFLFPKFPKWIGQLSLLSSLDISVTELCKDDVVVLGGLPVLVRLILYARHAPEEGIVFSDMSFRVLYYFRYPYMPAGVNFQAGAMPNLASLRLRFWAHEVTQHGVRLLGMEHLPNLKRVLVDMLYLKDDESDVQIVESEIRNAFDVHPGHPNILIRTYQF